MGILSGLEIKIYLYIYIYKAILSLLFNLTQIKLVPSLENYDEAQTHRIHNYIS